MLRVSLLAESPGGTLELMAIITHIAIQLLTSHYEDVHTQKEQFVLNVQNVSTPPLSAKVDGQQTESSYSHIKPGPVMLLLSAK